MSLRARAFTIFAFLEAVLLLWSWQKWAGPEVDAGFNFYTFWRLASGDVLYRDLAYYHGPLAPYLCAGLERIFGVSILTLALAHAALVFSLLILIYELLARTFHPNAGLAAGLFFLFVFAFSQYLPAANYNYILPYKPEALYGLWLGFAGLAAGTRLFTRPRARSFFVAGLCVGAALLTSAEFALAAFLSGSLLAAWGLARQRRAGLPVGRLAAAWAAGGALPVGAAWLWLARYFPAGEALRHALTAELLPLAQPDLSQNLFYRTTLGTAELSENLALTLFYSAVVPLFLAVVGGLDFATRGWSVRARGALAAGVVAQVFALAGGEWVARLGRSLPLFSFLVAAGYLGAARHRREAPLVAAWAIFSAVLLLKIGLRVRLAHYGVFLAMPGTLLALTLFSVDFPEWLALRGGGQLARHSVLWMAVGVAVCRFLASNEIYARKNFRIGEGTDSIAAMDPQVWPPSGVIELAREWTVENVPPFATLLTLPEGTVLNYFARRTRPGPYTFNFVELLTHGEGELLRAWQAHPPDFVAIVPNSYAEYGFPPFGQTEAYGKATMDWVRSNYEEVKLIGERPFVSRGFGVLFLRRR